MYFYTKLFKHLDARPRLLFSVIVLGLTYVLVPSWILLPTRLIIAWNAGVFSFLSLALVMMNGANPQKMRRNAQIQDESRWTILILVVASACASLLAITMMLKGGKSLSDWRFTLHVTLAVMTIIFSWLLVHIMFALHYAHLYYCDDRDNANTTEGLEFPSEKNPDYWDFMYFSFIIGMTCQVSDVQIASRPIRRLALWHGMLTFFFNTVILALSINIVAGLI